MVFIRKSYGDGCAAVEFALQVYLPTHQFHVAGHNMQTETRAGHVGDVFGPKKSLEQVVLVIG